VGFGLCCLFVASELLEYVLFFDDVGAVVAFELQGVFVFCVEFGFDWFVAVGDAGGVGASDDVFDGLGEFDFLLFDDFVVADDVDGGMWGD